MSVSNILKKLSNLGLLLVGGIGGACIAHYTADSPFWNACSQWLFTGDFLKTIIAVVLGGIVTGYVSHKIGKDNNIAAMNRLKKELYFKRDQSMRDECRKYCIDFLTRMDTRRVPDNILNDHTINELITGITLFSDKVYACQAISLIQFAHDHRIAICRDTLSSEKTANQKKIKYVLEEYTKRYAKLLMETSNMLIGRYDPEQEATGKEETQESPV